MNPTPSLLAICLIFLDRKVPAGKNQQRSSNLLRCSTNNSSIMLLRPTLLTVLLFMTTQLTLGQKSVGIFTGNTDVGNPLNKGSVIYDEAQQRYVIEGAGTNMWT